MIIFMFFYLENIKTGYNIMKKEVLVVIHSLAEV